MRNIIIFLLSIVFLSCDKMNPVDSIYINQGSKAYLEIREMDFTTDIINGNLYIKSFNNTKYEGDFVIPSKIKGRLVVGILEKAFNECEGFKSVTMPSTIVDIKIKAFYNCSQITKVTLSTSDKFILGNIFFNSPNIGEVVINDGSKTIAERAFFESFSLTSVTIPNSVINIGSNSFHRCISIKNITIPSSVKVIGYKAFHDCIKLENIKVEAVIPPSKGSTEGYEYFGNIANNFKISVPNESVLEYKKAEGWKNYADKIVGY